MGKIIKSGIEYSGGGGGESYTPGDGISIVNGVISADTTVLATIQYVDSAISALTIPTVVQSTGQSTDDVMSQKAATDMIFADKIISPQTSTDGRIIRIGENAQTDNWLPQPNQEGSSVAIGTATSNSAAIAIGTLNRSTATSSISIGNGCNSSDQSVAIGDSVSATNGSIKIGKSSSAIGQQSISLGTGMVRGDFSIGLGTSASVGNGIRNSVALGSYSSPTRSGEINIGARSGSSNYGYNNTAYRVLGGVHDGVEQHDAATVMQGNKLMTAAPTNTDEGVLGQLWTDTTAMHTYQCTAIDTTDPDNPVYTWTQRW